MPSPAMLKRRRFAAKTATNVLIMAPNSKLNANAPMSVKTART